MMIKPAAIFLFLLAPAVPQAAEPSATIAVLSSDRGAYREAFSAFQAEMGSEVMYFDLSKGRLELPAGIRRVVAFGARAAGLRYPPGTDLVYCLSPGFFRKPSAGVRVTKVSMRPAPGRLLSGLLSLQPGLKRLSVFWSSDQYTPHMEEIRKAAGSYGIEISLARVRRSSQLPGVLRASLGKLDAFWLPPDPLLVTRGNLRMLREFSSGNSLPMYGTTRGMAEGGAAAALGASFRSSGVAAARALKDLLEGRHPPEIIYSGEIDVILNSGAARRCGLEFPSEAMKSAAYIFP